VHSNWHRNGPDLHWADCAPGRTARFSDLPLWHEISAFLDFNRQQSRSWRRQLALLRLFVVSGYPMMRPRIRAAKGELPTARPDRRAAGPSRPFPRAVVLRKPQIPGLVAAGDNRLANLRRHDTAVLLMPQEDQQFQCISRSASSPSNRAGRRNRPRQMDHAVERAARAWRGISGSSHDSNGYAIEPWARHRGQAIVRIRIRELSGCARNWPKQSTCTSAVGGNEMARLCCRSTLARSGPRAQRRGSAPPRPPTGDRARASTDAIDLNPANSARQRRPQSTWTRH